MRNILLIILCTLTFSLTLSAQDEEGSGIALNIIVPDLGEEFDATTRTTLKTKLERIATNYGVAGSNYNPNFVLVPEVLIEGHEMIGSAPTRTLSKLNVVLKIANAQSKTVFTTTSIKTSGVGDNQKEAMREALNKLDTRSDELKSFIKGCKEEIINYYDQHCNQIVQKAETKASADQYQAALSFLYRIPSGTHCYDQAQQKIAPIFEKFQKKKCRQLLTAAESAYGAGNMDQAARFLVLIPNDSECHEKAREIASKMKDERMTKWEDKVEVAKIKAKAARDIAMAWAKNRPEKDVDITFLQDDSD